MLWTIFPYDLRLVQGWQHVLKPLILLVAQLLPVTCMMPFSLACSGPGGSNAEHPATEMVVTQSRGQHDDEIFVPLDPLKNQQGGFFYSHPDPLQRAAETDCGFHYWLLNWTFRSVPARLSPGTMLRACGGSGREENKGALPSPLIASACSLHGQGCMTLHSHPVSKVQTN